MKIGDLEVPDSAIEAELKKSGKRIADDADYLKKAEAAADLAKFRAVTGDNRSIEEIEGIIKAFEESKKKNQTQTELLAAEAKRLATELQAAQGQVKAAQLEVKKRDVKLYFDEAMVANKTPIIDSIIEPFRQKFYEVDETSLTPEALKAQVNDALSKAVEIQKGELLRLGLNGINPESAPSFGSGYTNPTTINVTPSRGQVAQSEGDLFKIMQTGAASPMGIPLMSPQQKAQK